MNGHKDAIPIGPITGIYEAVDAGNDVLVADAIVWNEEYPDVSEYLKKRTSENNPVAQSWELYFGSSEKDADGIEWLQDCVFSAACFVDNPAYGPTRTRILSIAENLQKEEANSLDEERQEIENLQNTLNSIWSMLDDFWFKTFEIEAAESTKTENLDTFSTRLNGLVTKLTDRANDAGVTLAETKAALETAQAELTVLKNEKEKAEKEALLAERKSKLAEVGIDVTEERKASILAMSEDFFNQYVQDLGAVQKKVATAENKNIPLPEPFGSTQPTNDEIKEAHKEHTKKSKRGI